MDLSKLKEALKRELQQELQREDQQEEPQEMTTKPLEELQWDMHVDTPEEFQQMGEDIRVQGGQESGPMSQLIFNPETGEFLTRPEGEFVFPGEMNVTDMTDDGFAC